MNDPDAPCNAMLADWLAGLFLSPPSESAVAFYRHGPGGIFLDRLAEEPIAEWGAIRMRVAVAGGKSSSIAARTLSASYTRLFSGILPNKTVSLYESAHVSPSNRLFQQPVSDMQRLLSAANVTVTATTCEPPDHLSIELALLAAFIRADAPSGQAMRLLDRLSSWVPLFTQACCDADPGGFYAGGAAVLAWFIASRHSGMIENSSVYAQ